MKVVRTRRSIQTTTARAVAVALALLLFLPAARPLSAADTLPSQLSDEAFWKMIGDFSEDGGFFTSENFSSNELGYQTLIPKLQAIVKPGGVYMGVGPEQNFQYIASLKPRIAFIVDIRRQNMIQHLMYKAAFELTSNRADFLSMIFARKRPEGLNASSTPAQMFDAYSATQPDRSILETNLKKIKDHLINRHGFKLNEEDQQTIDHVYEVFALYGPALNYSSNIDALGRPAPSRGGGNNVAYSQVMTVLDNDGMNRSYLASEESFEFIRELQQKNLLIPVVGNFGGPRAIRSVAGYLKEHGATVSAFYLSNVEQYLFRPPQQGAPIYREFYENVATLPLDEASTFIRSGNLPSQGRGGLTPMMSSILEVLAAFKAEKIFQQRDVIDMSTN